MHSSGASWLTRKRSRYQCRLPDAGRRARAAQVAPWQKRCQEFLQIPSGSGKFCEAGVCRYAKEIIFPKKNNELKKQL
jgi:hypothetical protein